MVPFFGWGLYTLNIRYRKHEEFHAKAEIITLASVVATLLICFWLLHASFSDDQLTYIFSDLGLVVAATALYGHMLVSLISQVFVDFFVPPHRDDHAPQLNHAEGLARVGDYEGALAEVFVNARIFPKDPTVAARAGDYLSELQRFEEAAQWFDRALDYSDNSESALAVANRLTEICSHRLSDPARAELALKRYLIRFPEAPRKDSVLRRIESMREPVVSVNAAPLPQRTLDIPDIDEVDQQTS